MLVKARSASFESIRNIQAIQTAPNENDESSTKDHLCNHRTGLLSYPKDHRTHTM